MKIKLGELKEKAVAMGILARMDMISETSYWLGRFHKKLQSELKQFDENVDRLRIKYGEWTYKEGKEVLVMKKEGDYTYWANEKGEKVDVRNLNPDLALWFPFTVEDGKVYSDEIKVLEELEIEIHFNPINLSRLVRREGSELKGINLPPAILAELDEIIIVPEPKEQEA